MRKDALAGKSDQAQPSAHQRLLVRRQDREQPRATPRRTRGGRCCPGTSLPTSNAPSPSPPSPALPEVHPATASKASSASSSGPSAEAFRGGDSPSVRRCSTGSAPAERSQRCFSSELATSAHITCGSHPAFSPSKCVQRAVYVRCFQKMTSAFAGDSRMCLHGFNCDSLFHR